MADFGLVVNGREYRGWKSFTVERSLETLCASFSFVFKEGLERAWPVVEGDECVITYDGKPVVTGYAETAELSIDGDSAISGRDRMADVVDSSPRLSKWNWKDTGAADIAKALCEPFGVQVRAASWLLLENVPRFSVDPGDTCGSTLQKLCSLAGALAIPTETGGLLLTRTGKTRCTTALIEGENLRAGSSRRDLRDRFAEYRVLAQAKGSNTSNGSYAAGVKGTAIDGEIRPQRMMVLRPDGSLTPEQAKSRAEWEASVRAAKSLQLTGLLVQGWTQADGSLWGLNTLVTVRSPRLRVDGEFLITKVSYSRSKANGTTTVMEVASPSAFTPEPKVKPKASGAWKELNDIGKGARS